MSKLLYLFTVVLLFCQSCKPQKAGSSGDAFEGIRANIDQVKFIGHKGSGDPPTYGYKNHIGNSYAAIENAILKTSGSEMDLQISADSTLWVFHDHTLLNCDSVTHNLALLTDHQIVAASQCYYHGELIKLSSLVERLSQLKVTDKVLSLDLKVLQNDEAIRSYGGMKSLAQAVIKGSEILNELTDFQILAEVPNMEYLEYFEDQSKFQVFLLARSKTDLLNQQPRGYSADIRLFETNDIAFDKAKKLQLWVVNSLESMLQAIKIKADFVQSDNIPLIEFVKKAENNHLNLKPLKSSETFGTNENLEYLNLSEFQINKLKENFLLQFTFKSGEGKYDTSLLVLACKNKIGKNVFWAGEKLKSGKTSYIKFIDVKKFKEMGGSELKVYIWNQGKVNFELRDMRFIQEYYPIGFNDRNSN